MIGIINYGLGNITAFANAYQKMGIPFKTVKKAEELKGVSRIILPGVGAFDYAIERLENSGLKSALEELTIQEKVPLLGICVGLQVMAKSSEEGSIQGLGWLNAEVKKLTSQEENDKILLPHMGWNNVDFKEESPLFKNIEKGARFYFLHSYYIKCEDILNEVAHTNYHERFCCAVNIDNIWAVQFHPEKSHHNGMMLLKNFAEL